MLRLFHYESTSRFSKGKTIAMNTRWIITALYITQVLSQINGDGYSAPSTPYSGNFNIKLDKNKESRLTNSEINSLIYGDASHDGIDWSVSHQGMGLKNIFIAIEGSTRKSLQDLESIRVEMVSLLSTAITSCNGGSAVDLFTTQVCPDGWQQYDGVCYWFSNRTATWQGAKADCAKYGAILAEPKDSKSKSFIYGHSISKVINYWIGLRDRKREGGFRWESTGDPVQFSNSVQGDPNNVHRVEHCILTTLHRKWTDTICDLLKHYVCQKTISGKNALQKMTIDLDLIKSAIPTNNQNEIDKLEKTGGDIFAKISEIITKVDQGQENVKLFSKQIEEALLQLKNIKNMAIGEQPSCLSDCKAWYDSGSHGDGVYCIKPDWSSTAPFNVYCDMTTDGGGWVVFQRRVDGSQDFFLGWDSYRDGFGNLTGEFWLGNKFIHMLTEKPSELRVDLLAWDKTTAFAKFSNFKIGDEGSKFKLTISRYSGTAGNALYYHNGQGFSTKDQDNSLGSGGCAKYAEGAWWYDYCSHSSLNGKYYVVHATSMHLPDHGVNWETFKGDKYSLRGSSMMVRRK